MAQMLKLSLPPKCGEFITDNNQVGQTLQMADIV